MKRAGKSEPGQSRPEDLYERRTRHWRSSLLAAFCSFVLSLLHRSWKTETVGLEHLENLMGSQERILVVFWHGKYLPFFTILRDRGACIFSSRSLRGEVIAGICRHFGHHCLTIPGYTGDEALHLMREDLTGRKMAAMVPDGPLGPYHQVKHGVIRLAADLGMTLLPASAAARPRLVLTRRWDRMEIPLPFSRVRLVIGPPVAVPRDLGGYSIAWWEQRVGDALETAGEEAEEGLFRRKK
jgi:lysophospholipid acyltransferase (LPLAT)-like uncharacterized protein